MRLMILCPFCGSHRTKTVGGADGDPYNRTVATTVCLDCGRTLPSLGVPLNIEGLEELDINDPDICNPESLTRRHRHTSIEIKKYIVIKMHAQACNTVREESLTVPFENGHHDFSGKEYPFTRYRGIDIEGDIIMFDGEGYKLTRDGIKIQRLYTAYDYSGIGWQETVDISMDISFSAPKK